MPFILFFLFMYTLGKASRKKVAVLLDFVKMRGGPAQIFWHIGVQKKWHKLSKLGGGGGGVKVISTKSKRIATFFVKPSLT